VTQIGSDYLYVDDGSLVRDGTYTTGQSNLGVRVACDPQGRQIGDYLVVTGVISCFRTPAHAVAGLVLPRSPDDIMLINR
jgi:hypothetical protein